MNLTLKRIYRYQIFILGLFFIYPFTFLNGAYAQTLTDSLQVMYYFDGNGADSSGNARHLTEHGGLTYTIDRHGDSNSAVKLDGQNDYLRLTNANGLTGNAISFTAWVRLDGWPSSGGNSLFMCLGNSSTDHGITAANNYLGYSGFTTFSYNNASSNVNTYNPNYGINLNTWYHVAMTRDNGAIRLYINGTLVSEDTYSNTNPGFGSSNSFWVGSRYGTYMFVNAAIDELRGYNRTLDSADIADIYYDSSGGNNNPANPVIPASICIDYKFQNNTLDSGGQGYHLTNNGGTFTQDRFGNNNSAILLDGVNDYLELSNADSFKTGAFTIAGWVKPVSLPTNNSQEAIVCFGDQTYDHGINFANNYLNTWDGFTGYSYNATSGNAGGYDAAGNVTINTNSWYHVAVTRNDSTLKFFINGQLIDTDNHGQDMGFNASGNKLWIGARYGTGSFFNGAVDDLHICNRALDDTLVTNMFDSLTTGIFMPFEQLNIRLYPNPSANGEFSIDTELEVEQVSVYNALGQAIPLKEVGRNQFSIDAENGIYIIRIQLENGQMDERKLLLQH